jgi:hypothetical protein
MKTENMTPATTAVALPAIGAAADAELIALAREYETSWTLGNSDSEASYAACYRACDLAFKILRMRVTTMAGLQAKARVALRVCGDEPEDDGSMDGDNLLALLVQDLERIAEVAA